MRKEYPVRAGNRGQKGEGPGARASAVAAAAVAAAIAFDMAVGGQRGCRCGRRNFGGRGGR